MQPAGDVESLRRLLGWVFHRSRSGCFSRSRGERDRALSDVNAWTEPYAQYWRSPSNPEQDGRRWGGESP